MNEKEIYEEALFLCYVQLSVVEIRVKGLKN